MTQTPTPTVIEEARKMAAAKCEAIGLWIVAAKIRCGEADSDPDVKFAIAAIELGERRAEAAVPSWLRNEHGKLADAYDALERGDHRSKPA